jgi:DNA-binding XRE family transcriptional regulator
MSTFILQNANNYFIICLGGVKMSEIVFKENLSYLRKLNNLSQAELGRELGCSRSCINKWESGARIPIVEDAIKVAEMLLLQKKPLLVSGLLMII